MTQLATAMNTYNAEFKDLHDIILATMFQFLQQTSWKHKEITHYKLRLKVYLPINKSRAPKKDFILFKCIFITESCRQFT